MSALPKEFEGFMTVAEAAAEAAVGQEAVRNAIYRGRLRATAVLGRQLISRADFNAWRARTKIGRPFKDKPAQIDAG